MSILLKSFVWPTVSKFLLSPTLKIFGLEKFPYSNHYSGLNKENTGRNGSLI